jgi:hypothetical protein
MIKSEPSYDKYHLQGISNLFNPKKLKNILQNFVFI